MRLGHGYLALTPLAKLLQFYVEEIARDTGESITAAVLQENEALVVAHQEPLRLGSTMMVMTVGTRLPLYSTAIGRVFLAYGPQDWAQEYLDTVKIIRRTPKSLGTRQEIEAAIEDVRTLGYAMIDEEMEFSHALGHADEAEALIAQGRPDGNAGESIGRHRALDPFSKAELAGDRSEQADSSFTERAERALWLVEASLA